MLAYFAFLDERKVKTKKSVSNDTAYTFFKSMLTKNTNSDENHYLPIDR